MKLYLLTISCVVLATVGCVKEPPPRSVSEFVENPILLEAAMVRCSADRNSTRYEAECINAREAVKRIEAKEEAARRAEFEKQSAEKRRALRRAQEAAAAARRRAAEQEKRRREAEYLAQFGVPMPVDGGDEQEAELGNSPLAVLPDPEQQPGVKAATNDSAPVVGTDANRPVSQIEPEQPGETKSDLDAIRDELKRRQEGDDS